MENDPARIEIALLRTARSVRKAFESRLRPLGLTMTEASLLTYVRDFGPGTQHELANRLHIGPARVGSVIDGLERRGLVTRTVDPRDRRAFRPVLTDDALPLIEAFESVDVDLRAELRAEFTRNERALLAHLLLHLEQNAEAAAARVLSET